MTGRIIKAARARAWNAIPPRRMWAAAVVRAGSGGFFLWLSAQLGDGRFAHALHTVGIVGVSLAVYTLILHFEGHAQDAIVRACVVLRDWLSGHLREAFIEDELPRRLRQDRERPGEHDRAYPIDEDETTDNIVRWRRR